MAYSDSSDRNLLGRRSRLLPNPERKPDTLYHNCQYAGRVSTSPRAKHTTSADASQTIAEMKLKASAAFHRLQLSL